MGKSESATKLIQTIDNKHLALFAQRLRDWLIAASVHDDQETAVSTTAQCQRFHRIPRQSPAQRDERRR